MSCKWSYRFSNTSCFNKTFYCSLKISFNCTAWNKSPGIKQQECLFFSCILKPFCQNLKTGICFFGLKRSENFHHFFFPPTQKSRCHKNKSTMLKLTRGTYGAHRIDSPFLLHYQLTDQPEKNNFIVLI